MTSVSIFSIVNTVTVTENGGSTVVAVPATSTVTAITEGPQGPQGTAGLTAYIHNQAIASSTWTINHNLGLYPSVEVFDSGSQEIDADILHANLNQTLILFSIPLSGFARLI